jgi:hypothetical protein
MIFLICKVNVSAEYGLLFGEWRPSGKVTPRQLNKPSTNFKPKPSTFVTKKFWDQSSDMKYLVKFSL